MARVAYKTPVQVGGTTVQVKRIENMCEDWTWRTVKLWGFVIGSIAVFWWIFQFGSWFGGHTVSPVTTLTTPATAPVVPPVAIVPTSTPTTPAPIPPTTPSASTVVKVEPIRIAVEVKSLPPSPATSSVKTGLPANVW